MTYWCDCLQEATRRHQRQAARLSREVPTQVATQEQERQAGQLLRHVESRRRCVWRRRRDVISGGAGHSRLCVVVVCVMIDS